MLSGRRSARMRASSGRRDMRNAEMGRIEISRGKNIQHNEYEREGRSGQCRSRVKGVNS